MNDKIEQIIINVLSWGAGLLSAYIIKVAVPKQVREDEHDKHQTETIEIQGRTLADAWKRIEQLEARDAEKQKTINDLVKKLDEFRKAYNRALKWIHEYTPPTVAIPDFFQDTGELKK